MSHIPPPPFQPPSTATASPAFAPPTGGRAPITRAPPPRQQAGAGRLNPQLPDPSGQVNPTVTPVRVVPNATWEVYAIHGLNSSVATWSGPGGFNWLNELSNYLTQSGGEAVSTFVIGWSTGIGQASNHSTSILASVRPLANTIIGRRGESASLAGKNDGRVPAKVIIIGHSMGGILARGLLGFMHRERAPNYDPFLRSIAGVILLASPSRGSALGNIAAPAVKALAALSGGMASLLNWSHLAALKPNSPELLTITQDFDEYCRWFQGTMSRSLPVHALRETAPVGLTSLRLSVMIVSLQSADIPPTTSGLVQGRVANLEGLNHMQVTGYSSMADPNLQIILSSFLEMQQTDRTLGRPQQHAIGSGNPGIPGAPAGRGTPLSHGGSNAAGSPFPGGPSGVPQGRGRPVAGGRGGPIMPPPAQLRQMTSGLQQGGQFGQPAAQERFY